jgi:hypothetical protein
MSLVTPILQAKLPFRPTRVLSPLALALSLAGCRSQPGATPPAPPPAPPSSATVHRTATAPERTASAPETGSAKALRQKQIAFLNGLRRSDPQFALVREVRSDAGGEPALMLQRELPAKTANALLKAALARLMQEFPGEDLKIAAYAPTQPSVPIGAAQLDAETLQISYALSSHTTKKPHSTPAKR